MGRINTMSRNSWTNKATGIPCKRKARFRQWKKSNESYIHKRIEKCLLMILLMCQKFLHLNQIREE